MSGDKLDPPCSICGWHCKKVWEFSNNHCAPKRGAVAKALLAKLVELPHVSGQLSGYGYGRLAISIGSGTKYDREMTFVLAVSECGTLDVDNVFWHRHDKPEAIEKLIAALSAFHEANP